MRLLILAGLLAAAPSFAQTHIGRSGADEVRMTEEACPYASVLRFITEDARKNFRKGNAYIQGKRWFVCWVKDDNGDYWLQYEDGDIGMVPGKDVKIEGA